MIVITAASGKLGRAVAAELGRLTDPTQVRLAARSPDKLDAFKARGFDVVQADYEAPASLEAAFTGADTVLLISGDAPTEPRIRQHLAALDAARRAGVKRVVYTSFANPTPESRFVWARVHAETEAALKASGLAWTLLRDNQYASNIDGLVAQAVKTGVLATPGVAGKVAYVTHADVAAAAAAALLGAGHEGQTYELSGAEALDGFEIAAEIAAASGRRVEAVVATPADTASHLRAIGLPEFVVEALVSIHAAAAGGEYATVTHDVQRLAGRPPASIREHVRALARA